MADIPSPEDAFFCDVDGDGQLEIVSYHEGRERQVWVHRLNPVGGPADRARDKPAAWLTRSRWTSRAVLAAKGQQWMYGMPLAIGSQRSIILGSKNDNASISLLSKNNLGNPSARRSRSGRASTGDDARPSWYLRELRDCGWIMSLESQDVDSDGDLDILFSDRVGSDRCLGWIEQPEDPKDQWPLHRLDLPQREWMFFSTIEDGIVAATRDGESVRIRNLTGRLQTEWIKHPGGIVMGKSISQLPDGSLILTANTYAQRQKDLPGIWYRGADKGWSAIDPTTHVKFDRVELTDVDGGGDLDVLTCEERQNLGVIWYENPGR